MAIFSRNKNNKRSSGQAVIGYLFGGEDEISISGYVPLSRNPEVQTAVNYIADLVSSMTIHLMKNTDNGDIRIKNELSRKLDIKPNRIMTRKIFIYSLVKQMLLTGNAIVYPEYRNGLLENLEFLPNATINSGNYTYMVQNDNKTYAPDEILNFICNPSISECGKGKGYTVELKDIVQNLAQAQVTKKSFMSSKYRPSLIVRVDSTSDELSKPEGRDKLLEQYMKTNEAGKPWVLPADMFDVKEIRPLSLKDIAINESVEIDKKTVARIIGVPNYVVGVGDFNKEEHRHFISTKIKAIAEIIAQELTNKLILSDKMYVMMSPISLYGYDLTELAKIGKELYVCGLMIGNEVRDWVHLPPRKELDRLVILENYIPADMISQQKKLKGNEE